MRIWLTLSVLGLAGMVLSGSGSRVVRNAGHYYQRIDSTKPTESELPGLYISPSGQDTLLLTIDSFGNNVYYLTQHDSNKVIRRASDWGYITEYDYDVDMPENCGELQLKWLFPTSLITGNYRTNDFDAAHDSLGRIFLCYDITNIKIEFLKVK